MSEPPVISFDLRGAEMTPQMLGETAFLARRARCEYERVAKRLVGFAQYVKWKRRQVRRLKTGAPRDGDLAGDIRANRGVDGADAAERGLSTLSRNDLDGEGPA